MLPRSAYRSIEVRPQQERILATVLMALLLVRVPGFSLMPIAAIPAVFFIPPLVWPGQVVVRRLALLTGLAFISGTLVTFATPGTVSGRPYVIASVCLWMASITLLAAVAWWALQRIDTRTGVLLMLGGGIASQLVAQGVTWKGTLGIFLGSFILILLARRMVASLICLGSLLLLGFYSDARSMVMGAGVAFLIAMVLRLQNTNTGSLRKTISTVTATALTAATGIWAFASGIAGADIQSRTLDQLGKANLLFGVRAEWAITKTLAQLNPFGYGIGARPSDGAVAAGMDAVRGSGGDWTASYFSDYVFGERVDLHSTAANLWFHFGLGGALLAAAIGVILFIGIRDSRALLPILGIGGIYLMVMAGWDLLFSPMADVDRLIAGLVVSFSALIRRSDIFLPRDQPALGKEPKHTDSRNKPSSTL